MSCASMALMVSLSKPRSPVSAGSMSSSLKPSGSSTRKRLADFNGFMAHSKISWRTPSMRKKGDDEGRHHRIKVRHGTCDGDAGKFRLTFARDMAKDAGLQHVGGLLRLQNLHQCDARSGE